MRWLFSIFRSRSSQGWTPVSNSDDHDEVGMAMGQCHEGENNTQVNNDSSVTDHNDSSDHHDDHQDPVFQHPQRLLTSSASLPLSSVSAENQPLPSSTSATDPELVCKVSCLCSKSKLTFPKRRWWLVLLSLLVALGFIGLNVGLGCYSLIFYKPEKLVIDKSVKAFSIPNHKAYRNFEAMMLARKYNSSAGRYRRDTSDIGNPSDRTKRAALRTKETEMLQETAFALENSNFKYSGFKRKKREPLYPHLFSSKSDSSSQSSQGSSIGSAVSGFLQRIKRSTHEIGCLFEYQSVARWKMHVIYLAHGNNDSNMFTKERLETAHAIERKIIEHPGFHDFCLRDPHLEKYDPAVRGMNGCVPVNSLLTYFFPSKDANGRVFYDGMGKNIDDIDSALKLAMTHETFYYYVDDKINKTYQKSHLLRSEVLFGAPLPGYSCVGEKSKDQNEKFKDFVVTYINILSKSSTDKVHVLYGGNEIFDYEVTTSFWGDIHLAVISLIAIFVLMLVLSLSLFLTVVGVVVIALSFPISLFFYRVVFGIDALGILNGAAAFVIIGIGVDDVFVFVNVYRQISHMTNPVQRIWCTIKTAGVATFFTSFTTAAAFAANIASSIPAVYEFGLFMSLIVASCWISVFTLMPPMLYLHACFFEPIEKLLFSCFACSGSKVGDPPVDSLHHYTADQTSGRRVYEDDDVPMLDIDGSETPGEVDDNNDDDDAPLLIDDPYNISNGDVQADDCDPQLNGSNPNADNNMCLGRLIQKIIMFLTNRVVIRGRFVVIGFYAAVLVASCLLMVRLQPSSHPPQLFRPDTNLQRLLDLKANFSIIDTLHCDRCSGFYKVLAGQSAAHQSHPSTTQPTIPWKYLKDKRLHRNTSMSATKSQAEKPVSHQTHDKDTVDKETSDELAEKDTLSLSQNLDKLSQNTDSVPLKMIAATLSKLLSSVSSSNSSSEDGESSTAWNTTLPLPLLPVNATTTELPPPPTIPTPTYPYHPQSGQEQEHKNIPHQSSSREQEQKESHGNQDLNKGNIHKTHPDWFPSKTSSLDENFNACKDQSCKNLKDRPLLESGATVYVVFGVAGVNRSGEDVGHVLAQLKGKPIFDPKFPEAFNLKTPNIRHLTELCKVCHLLANHTELVKPGSAQCLPSGIHSLHKVLGGIPECRNLPGSLSIYHHQAPAHAEGGVDRDRRLIWLAFAFESTTSEGQAYFEAYKQYEKWEVLMSHIKHNILSHDSPLHSMFQTSEFWTKVLMEVVAVNSAIYGLVLSMVICIGSVAIFTGHIILLAIVGVTILTMICCVVGVFYLAGWEMGAVEAVSLSILVGSSVDYCVHIVEGFILAGRRMPELYLKNQPASALRKQRTSLAVRHIGVAIICSALTTIIAAVPLTQTYIQPFAKFGSILLINTTVSVVMTLTLAVAMLASFGPARYRGSVKSHVIAFITVVGVKGSVVLGLYIASTQGLHIPGPSGTPLFS